MSSGDRTDGLGHVGRDPANRRVGRVSGPVWPNGPGGDLGWAGRGGRRAISGEPRIADRTPDQTPGRNERQVSDDQSTGIHQPPENHDRRVTPSHAGTGVDVGVS